MLMCLLSLMFLLFFYLPHLSSWHIVCMCVSVDVLREEEEARSGNPKHKRKVQAVGLGSGETDDATEVLGSIPTALYQEPTTKGKNHSITLYSLKKKKKKV